MGMGVSFGTMMSDSFSSLSADFLGRRSPFSAFGAATGLDGFACLAVTSDGEEFDFSAATLGGATLAAITLGAVALGGATFAAIALGAAALGGATLGGATFAATTLGALAFGAAVLGGATFAAATLGAVALGAAGLPTETFGRVAGAVCLAVTPVLTGALDCVDTAGRSDLAGVGGDFLEGALAAGFFSFVLDIVARLRDARSRLSRSRWGWDPLKSSGGSQPKCDNRQVGRNGDLGIGIGAVDQLDRSTDQFAGSGIVRHAQSAGLDLG